MKSNTFWLPSALVEAEAGQGTSSCMPCHHYHHSGNE